jgi:hypothetical protein
VRRHFAEVVGELERAGSLEIEALVPEQANAGFDRRRI